MTITDDGSVFVLTAEPRAWLVWAGRLFLLLTVFGVAVGIYGLVFDRRLAELSCDRARGTCVFGDESVPLRDIRKASLLHSRGHRNETASDRALLLLRDRREIPIGDKIYNDAPSAKIRDLVDGLNVFLADETKPTFRATYQPHDTDQFMLVLHTLTCAAVAYVLLRAASSVRVVVTRASRTVQVERRAVGAPTERDSILFQDVQSVTITSHARSEWIGLRTTGGAVRLVQIPQKWVGGREVPETAQRLASALSVPVETPEV